MKKIILPLLSLLLLFGCSSAPTSGVGFAKVTFSIGDVLVNGQPAEIGMSLAKNDKIMTGKRSSCDIKIGKSIIRVKQNSALEFSELLRLNGKDNSELNLSKGAMLCRPKKLLPSENFIVTTPTMVAGVRGTNFLVEVDQETNSQVRVYTGSVRVAKNIKQLKSKKKEILQKAPVVSPSEEIVILKKDVEKAEKEITSILKKEGVASIDQLSASDKMLKVISKKTLPQTKNIKKFKKNEFQLEKQEIFAVKEKPQKVVKNLRKRIRTDQRKPSKLGVIVLSENEGFFIKNGQIEREENISVQPLQNNNLSYVTFGDKVFCYNETGEVLWQKPLKDQGKLSISENKLMIQYPDQTMQKYDLKTGK